MRTINKRYTRKYTNIIASHIQNNLREYTIASIIFVIGILLGIVFFNNLNSVQTSEINTYLSNSIISLKENGHNNELSILKDSVQKNFLLVILLWLMGSTVIGLLLVYLVVCFKGFCFGFTISSILYALGTGKGIILFLSTMLLKNIIDIPCTVALAVSGMNLYKSIMQDRRKENIKLEVVRHTLFSLLMLLFLIISSSIEAYISHNILQCCLKYL